MTATNHALTGAVIGLTVGSPWIALPAALLSHFVCDALPHYGSAVENTVFLRSNHFKRVLMIDATLCVTLVLVLGFNHPLHWFLASLCAFVATSPDLLWIGTFVEAHLDKEIAYRHWFLRFAGRIQWFQRPIGAAVEVAWFGAGIFLISTFLH